MRVDFDFISFCLASFLADSQRQVLDSMIAGATPDEPSHWSKAVLRRIIELDAPVPLFAKFIAGKDRTQITKWQQLELIQGSSSSEDVKGRR